MTVHKLFAAVLLAAAGGLLHADDIDTYELKPNLVVTPSRRVEPLDQSLASVSVITREDIELSVAEDLFELLRLQPGVDIVRTGGPGTQTSVFLRGSNSNHVLVLIDGVRASSTNTGAYAWEQLPLNQVERVEIVRGPRGSLYGSDSIGGVIHVFTRSSRGRTPADGRQLRHRQPRAARLTRETSRSASTPATGVDGSRPRMPMASVFIPTMTASGQRASASAPPTRRQGAGSTAC
jgi:outer membrane cobalamin receptor